VGKHLQERFSCGIPRLRCHAGQQARRDWVPHRASMTKRIMKIVGEKRKAKAKRWKRQGGFNDLEENG
jgi:hypothetical protein